MRHDSMAQYRSLDFFVALFILYFLVFSRASSSFSFNSFFFAYNLLHPHFIFLPFIFFFYFFFMLHLLLSNPFFPLRCLFLYFLNVAIKCDLLNLPYNYFIRVSIIYMYTSKTSTFSRGITLNQKCAVMSAFL